MNLSESDLPTRSSDGMAALDIFYSGFNDINFYVEDEDQENLYEVILKKQFPDIVISRIFPLGGKKAVLAHAGEKENESIEVFRAYLLDKDFDDLLNIQVKNNGIFYLHRFCIENYLTDHEAAVELVIENHPKKSRGEISENLELEKIIEETYNNLRPLFTLFYCVQSLELGIKNCNSAPESYCNSKALWQLNNESVATYTEKIRVAAAEIGVVPPILDPMNDSRFSKLLHSEPHGIVSGKFAAAMMFHYIKSKYSLGSMTFESFMYRLAKNSQMHEFFDVANLIKSKAEEFKNRKIEKLSMIDA